MIIAADIGTPFRNVWKSLVLNDLQHERKESFFKRNYVERDPYPLKANFFWKGKKPLRDTNNYETTDQFIDLYKVHSLQILYTTSKGEKKRPVCGEPNLILESGRRVNVVFHFCSDLDRLREDAERLSQLLDKPLWDATRH